MSKVYKHQTSIVGKTRHPNKYLTQNSDRPDKINNRRSAKFITNGHANKYAKKKTVDEISPDPMMQSYDDSKRPLFQLRLDLIPYIDADVDSPLDVSPTDSQSARYTESDTPFPSHKYTCSLDDSSTKRSTSVSAKTSAGIRLTSSLEGNRQFRVNMQNRPKNPRYFDRLLFDNLSVVISYMKYNNSIIIEVVI